MAKGEDGGNGVVDPGDNVQTSAASPLRDERSESRDREPKVQESKDQAGPDGRWIAFIDIISRDAIHGWAYDSHNPETSLAIEAVASNGKRLVTIANLERADVREAGHGTGKYGFVLEIASLGLKDESILVRFADSKQLITPEPVMLSAERAVLLSTMPSGYVNAMVLAAAQVRIAAELKGVAGEDLP